MDYAIAIPCVNLQNVTIMVDIEDIVKDPVIKFIEGVRYHKCIWDMQSEDYYNKKMYKSAWQTLIVLVYSEIQDKAENKKKVAELKEFWVMLRDSYYKNEDPGKQYKESLQFLQSVYQSREVDTVLDFDVPSWNVMDLRTWTEDLEEETATGNKNATGEVNATSTGNNTENASGKDNETIGVNTTRKGNATDNVTDKEKVTDKGDDKEKEQLTIWEKAMRLHAIENPGGLSSNEDKSSKTHAENSSQTDETDK